MKIVEKLYAPQNHRKRTKSPKRIEKYRNPTMRWICSWKLKASTFTKNAEGIEISFTQLWCFSMLFILQLGCSAKCHLVLFHSIWFFCSSVSFSYADLYPVLYLVFSGFIFKRCALSPWRVRKYEICMQYSIRIRTTNTWPISEKLYVICVIWYISTRARVLVKTQTIRSICSNSAIIRSTAIESRSYFKNDWISVCSLYPCSSFTHSIITVNIFDLNHPTIHKWIYKYTTYARYLVTELASLLTAPVANMSKQ